MNKTAKTLAIISMALAFAAIILAVVFDVIALKEVIFQFVLSLILPIIAFVILFIGMIASFIFVFGVFIVKEYGFWPLKLSIDFFEELLSEIKITSEAVQLFLRFRIALAFICACIIVVAILSKVLSGPKEKGVDENGKKIKRKGGFRAMSTVGLILGILGLVVSVAAIALAGQI